MAPHRHGRGHWRHGDLFLPHGFGRGFFRGLDRRCRGQRNRHSRDRDWPLHRQRGQGDWRRCRSGLRGFHRRRHLRQSSQGTRLRGDWRVLRNFGGWGCCRLGCFYLAGGRTRDFRGFFFVHLGRGERRRQSRHRHGLCRFRRRFLAGGGWDRRVRIVRFAGVILIGRRAGFPRKTFGGSLDLLDRNLAHRDIGRSVVLPDGHLGGRRGGRGGFAGRLQAAQAGRADRAGHGPVAKNLGFAVANPLQGIGRIRVQAIEEMTGDKNLGHHQQHSRDHELPEAELI